MGDTDMDQQAAWQWWEPDAMKAVANTHHPGGGAGV